MIAKSWMNKLLPHGQVVGAKEGAVWRYMFVLWSTGGAAAVWPVRVLPGLHCNLDLSKGIEFFSVTSLAEDKLKVLPTRGTGPLRALVMQRLGKAMPNGLSLLATGVAVSLVQWHHARGYAKVPEAVMKKLTAELNCKPLPTDVAGTAETPDLLATQLYLHGNPNASLDEVRSTLCRRQGLEKDWEDPDPIDQAILDEVLPNEG
jgi:hypothetical protein